MLAGHSGAVFRESRIPAEAGSFAPFEGAAPDRTKGPATCRALRGVNAIRTTLVYCTALIMSKMGRYMATTMPPTTTPRNTIITGSIKLSRLLTAASTSSS